MKVFVAGVTGAIGRHLLPRLVAAGHEVHGMTRTATKRTLLEELGAVPVVCDALADEQVAESVARAKPDVVVHQLTAIGRVNTRHMERDFSATNRLRMQGTDNLLAAAQAAGVRRFIAQSHVIAYARTGSAIKSEDDPLDTSPPQQMRQSQAAIAHLESKVLEADWIEGMVLRYGWFYGSETSLAPGSETFRMISKRLLPLIGDGNAVWSFIHIADAAAATLAAIEVGKRGPYNIVDDEPAPVAQWLPWLAKQLKAKTPFHVPRFLGRLLAGEVGVMNFTELRGASNAKAKSELGWRPANPSWRLRLATG